MARFKLDLVWGLATVYSMFPENYIDLGGKWMVMALVTSGWLWLSSPLIWVASGWLWLSSPLYIGYLVSRPTMKGAWSWVTYLKMITAVLMLALVIIYIVTAVDDLKAENSYWRASLVGPVIEGAKVLLVLLYITLERYKGFVTSGVLFMYWTVAIVTYIIPFYSKILQRVYETNLLDFVTLYIYFGLLIIQWVLHCIAEDLPNSQEVCPEQKASFLSRITYNWITSLMIKGYKKPLVEDDMFNLNQRDLCKHAYRRFLKNWNKEVLLKSDID